MIKRTDLLEAFEREQIRKNDASYLDNLRLFEALYREAQALGVLPLADPLEGIDVDIRLAQALHVRTVTGENC
jgi:hypothetical protein